MIEGEEMELFARSLGQATAASSGADLDAALFELGWRDALAADPPTAVSLLFELQGHANATSSALDVVLATALGFEAGGLAVILPVVGATAPPGTRSGTTLAVEGLGTAALAGAETALVACGPDEPRVVGVPTDRLAPRPVDGLDPALGLVEVTGADLPFADDGATGGSWTDALAIGQRALAHELVGAARAVLGLARDHAVDRIQFGQPIAAFQAVRHKLADVLVAVESADAAVEVAWAMDTAEASAVAKAVAGRSARLAVRHAHQILAGIGFTAEHALHHYVRRVLVLESLLGDTTSLTESLGAEILRTRRLPSSPPL